MKKILSALLLCFTTFFAVQAQTKEETIIWLQDKLSKYLSRTSDSNIENLSIKVETCHLIISYSWFDSNYEIEVPTDSTTFAPIIKTKGERIYKKQLSTNKKSYNNGVTFIYLPEGEKDLNVRVIKALNHLATFCPIKKETF